MAHIGILCPPVAGHLNPMTTVGRSLRKRGHTVTVFQVSGLKARVESEGLAFWPLRNGQDQAGDIEAAVARLGQMSGLQGIRYSIDCGKRLATLVCKHAPAALRAAGVDLALVDPNEPAGASVAGHLGLPFVNIGSLPLNREPDVPPPFVPWQYRGDSWATIPNRLAYALFDRLVAPIHAVLNHYRREWNLPLVSRPDDTFSRLAQLYQVTEDFDFPRKSKPACSHYLGPFCDAARPPVPFPYKRLTGKPLVYASFGTLQNRREQSFRIVAEACADLDVQLVLSAGGGQPVREEDLPGSPIVVAFAPQLALLARAALCISHAGLNTVMESLRFAVPMVAVPVTNDQPAVAARLQRTGAGEAISLSRLTNSRLRAAIKRVLDDPDYLRQAERQKQAIERAGGVEQAANIIEQVLATRQPVTTAAATAAG